MECKVLSVSSKESLINHPIAGTRIFSARQIAHGDVSGYYFGSLMFKRMTQRQYTKKKYGEDFMHVTPETSRQWVN